MLLEIGRFYCTLSLLLYLLNGIVIAIYLSTSTMASIILPLMIITFYLNFFLFLDLLLYSLWNIFNLIFDTWWEIWGRARQFLLVLLISTKQYIFIFFRFRYKYLLWLLLFRLFLLHLVELLLLLLIYFFMNNVLQVWSFSWPW